MNPSQFDKIVENRTNERVKDKIRIFEQAIGAAFTNLHSSLAPTFYYGWPVTNTPKNVELIFKALQSGRTINEWPAILWESERERVTQSLLATMDEMQKALCAPAPSEDGPKPATKEIKP